MTIKQILQDNIEALTAAMEAIDGYGADENQELLNKCFEAVKNSEAELNRLTEVEAKSDFWVYVYRNQINFDKVFEKYEYIEAFDRCLRENSDLLGVDGDENYERGISALEIINDLSDTSPSLMDTFAENQIDLIFDYVKKMIKDRTLNYSSHSLETDVYLKSALLSSFLIKDYKDLKYEVMNDKDNTLGLLVENKENENSNKVRIQR